MRVLPILFNTDMVRALLDGRKTVTRRVVKPQPTGAHMVLDSDEEARTFDLLCGNGGEGGTFIDWAETVKAPYWPGDILYVRETWAAWSRTEGLVPKLYYKADGNAPDSIKWHPSIHMPKEAARLFLRVTDVRVERLQDIDYEGCKAEGIWDDYKTYSEKYHENLARMAYPRCFYELWDSTIKKADLPLYGWAADPWVWVIEFERISEYWLQQPAEEDYQCG